MKKAGKTHTSIVFYNKEKHIEIKIYQCKFLGSVVE